jgi:hypothetical protein
MGGNNELVREERNESNEYEQSGKSCESNKCTCDPGSNASCTCTGATSGTTTSRGTATTGHTSFPCAHCRDNDSTTNGLVRKHKYSSISTTTTLSSAADYNERDYADYISATSSGREDIGTGVRGGNESGNIKQADADSGDTVERRIGIPAGVTV